MIWLMIMIICLFAFILLVGLIIVKLMKGKKGIRNYLLLNVGIVLLLFFSLFQFFKTEEFKTLINKNNKDAQSVKKVVKDKSIHDSKKTDNSQEVVKYNNQKYQELVNQFVKNLYINEKEANDISKKFEDIVKKAKNGEADEIDVTRIAMRASSVYNNASLYIKYMDTPKELPNDIKMLLNKAKKSISDAYQTKSYAMSFLCNNRGAYDLANQFKEMISDGDKSMSYGISIIYLAKEETGADLTK